MTVAGVFLCAALNAAGADVCAICQVAAALGCHFNFKMVPFGKNFHPQQIGTFSPGSKIKGPFRRVVQSGLGVKKPSNILRWASWDKPTP